MPSPAFIAIPKSRNSWDLALIGGFVPISSRNLIPQGKRGRRFQKSLDDAQKALQKRFPSNPPPELAIPLTDVFGITIDGESAGLAAWLQGWFHIHRFNPGLSLAATGSVGSTGRVFPVQPESLDRKIAAALSTGYDHVLAPKGNCSGSAFARDRRVLWIEHTDELIDWFFSQSLWNARRDLDLYLTGKTSLSAEVALEGLERLFREHLVRDRPNGLIRDVRAALSESRSGDRAKLFREVLEKLKGLYLRLDGGSTGSPGKHDFETWVHRLRHLLSAETFFFHIPFILRSAVRQGLEPFARRLEHEFRHRLLDHDVDAALATISGRPFFDPLSPSRHLFFHDPGFRGQFPNLLWITFTDPARAVLILCALEKPLPHEREWLDLWLEALDRIDPRDYARLESGSDHDSREKIDSILRGLRDRVFPGLRSEMADPCGYGDRLEYLWRSMRHLYKAGKRQQAAVLERHFRAHLEAPKPAGNKDLPRSLADYPGMRGFPELSLKNPSVALERLRKDDLKNRKVLGGLRKAVKAEASVQGVGAANRQSIEVPPSTTSPQGWVRTLRSMFPKLSNLGKHETLLPVWGEPLNGALLSQLLQKPSVGGDQARASFFIQPALHIAMNALHATSYPLVDMLTDLQGWMNEHGCGRRLAAQCLAHFAIRCGLGKQGSLPAKIPRQFRFAAVTAWHQAGHSPPATMVDDLLDRLPEAEPEEFLWLLWIPADALPVSQIRERQWFHSLQRSVATVTGDFDAARLQTRLAALAGSSLIHHAPSLLRKEAAKAVETIRSSYLDTGSTAHDLFLACAPWLLLARGESTTLRRVFPSRVSRAATSPFSILYAALNLCPPDQACHRDLMIDEGNLGDPRFWRSSLERSMFETVRLFEAHRAGDRQLFEHLFLWKIESLGNLFFAASQR